MYRWTIVGGGIHGTYLARELVEGGVAHEDLAIIERGGRLLDSFRQHARACGMESMRSNYVHHVGPTPFALETFASARDREDELIPTHNHQPRPTLELFLDYAEHVIERFGLDELVHETTATGIQQARDRPADGADEPLVVRTTDGSMPTRNVILAIGPGGTYRRPSWTDADDRIEHVWDGTEPPEERIEPGENVWVVGGGITAAQFGTAIAETAGDVTVCARGGLDTALLESEPPWLNWKKITAELHSLPPGSKAREKRVRSARNDGTVPPYLASRLRADESITVRAGRIRGAVGTSSGVILSVRDGLGNSSATDPADRVFLATGFDSVYDNPLVTEIASDLDLKRGYRGMPVLDDGTLRWQRRDGSTPNLFVTGALACCTLGPFGPNIAGARRSAERIVPNAAKS